MPLENAMQALLRENYNSFLLTILSTTVAIYCATDGKFKIFDSHARDSLGMPHPRGICVLLEVNALNELINYFQMVYPNPDVTFELKGVHITEMVCDMTEITDQQTTTDERDSCTTDANDYCHHKHSFGMLLCYIFLLHLFFHDQVLWILECSKL